MRLGCRGWKRILNPGKIHKHMGKIYENVSKIPEILSNLPENTDKNGYQRYLILKNWRRTWGESCGDLSFWRSSQK